MPFMYKSNQLPVTGIQGFKNDLMVLFWYSKLQGLPSFMKQFTPKLTLTRLFQNRFFYNCIKWFRSIITVATMHGLQFDGKLIEYCIEQLKQP